MRGRVSSCRGYIKQLMALWVRQSKLLNIKSCLVVSLVPLQSARCCFHAVAVCVRWDGYLFPSRLHPVLAAAWG